MDEQELKRAQGALDIPELGPIDPKTAQITRLGGMTNLVYRVDAGKEILCLRLPGEGTEEYINRMHEEIAARETARAGVSPEVLYAAPDRGIMVTRFIEGAVTMSPSLFGSTNGAASRAGKAFRQLHDSGAVFGSRFELFNMIDEYLSVLSGKEVDLPEGYHETLKDSAEARKALEAHPLPQAPCHCDPLCENFLDTGDRMWIVDWEYSGMNDPMWDLGDLSVEAGLDTGKEEELLLGYFGSEPNPNDRGRMVVYKAMCDLLWTLWGLIQHANDNPAEDFWEYSVTRFGRCTDLMAADEFVRSVAAVRKGS